MQNKLQQAIPLLPPTVQQQGVGVNKSQPSTLVCSLPSTTRPGRYTNIDIADFIASRLQDPISRIPGVGAVQVFGAQYAMRIWLNPVQAATYNLTVGDVRNAVQAQNAQVSAGELGAPARRPRPGARRDRHGAVANCRRPISSANIILKSSAGGGVVRLRDVARVELGAEDYSVVSRMNAHAGIGHGDQAGAGRQRADDGRRRQGHGGEALRNLPAGREARLSRSTIRASSASPSSR